MSFLVPIEMCKVGVAYGAELARDEDILAAGPTHL